MGLEAAAALARDVAAIVFGVAAALTAIALLSGVAGASVGLASAASVIALAALASFAVFGLLGWAAGASLGWIGLIAAVLALSGAFLGGHWYGVRGLWIAVLCAIGAGLAWLFLWAFGRAPSAPLGAAGPLAAFALLAFLTFGALGAVSSAAKRAGAGAGNGGSGALRMAAMDRSAALSQLSQPPAWFDCAYAALGGQAEAPGRCVLTPPEQTLAERVASAAPRGAPDPALLRTSAQPDEAPTPPVLDSVPEEPASPASLETEWPAFDRETEVTVAAGPAPTRPDSAAPAASPRQEGPDAAPPEPEKPVAPALLHPDASLATSSVQPPLEAGPVGAPERSLASAETPSPGGPDQGFSTDRADETRRRSALVCFPMLEATSERLCPDRSLTARDIEVRWVGAGGESLAETEGVECYVEQNASPHATLAVNLSGALTETLPRGAGASGETTRGDAIYDAVTRLVGAVRLAPEDAPSARLRASLYVVNGSSLMSPWASQEFGVGRADRLFDLRVGGQTLALLRRLKDELMTLRRTLEPGDVAGALVDAMAGRPDDPASAAGPMQPLMVLLTDPDAAVMSRQAEQSVIDAFRAAGAPFFAIELGGVTPSRSLTRIAEATGGATFVAADAATLEATMADLVLRARSFCTVKVSAPETFFDGRTLEIRLRRRLKDACVLEQVAELDCARLTISERFGAASGD